MENKKKGPETRRCPICRRLYEGFGNNAMPVWPGRCCDRCNKDYVIPMRMILMRQINEENEKK